MMLPSTGRAFSWQTSKLGASLATPLLLGLMLISSLLSAEKPQRIVSFNLCSDILLLQLVEPSRLAAITWLGRDPENSPVADWHPQVPSIRNSVEAVILLRPDLVVINPSTSGPAAQLLRKLGVPLHELGFPATFPAIHQQIRQLAQAVGAEARGEALIQEMVEHTARLQTLTASQPPYRALVFGYNGFTDGPESLLHPILALAGLTNQALVLSPNTSRPVSLETLVLYPPDYLVEPVYYEQAPTLGDQRLHHPALRSSRPIPVLRIPMAQVICATNFSVLAAVSLQGQLPPP
jgi:iron complex transport system substrate-binding protein